MADLDERTDREAEKLKAEAPEEKLPEDISDRLQTNTKQGSELEQKTNQTFFQTLKQFSLWDWTKVAGTAALGAGIGGFMNLVATTGTYILAHWTLNRKKINKNDLQGEMHLGNVMTGVLYYSFNMLDKITSPIYKTAAGLFGMVPIVTAILLPLEYIFKKYNPSRFIYETVTTKIRKLPGELYNDVYKPLYSTTMKNVYKYFALPFSLIINYVPIKFQIVATGAGRYLYRLIAGKVREKVHDSNNANKQITPSYKPAYGGAQ